MTQGGPPASYCFPLTFGRNIRWLKEKLGTGPYADPLSHFTLAKVGSSCSVASRQCPGEGKALFERWIELARGQQVPEEVIHHAEKLIETHRHLEDLRGAKGLKTFSELARASESFDEHKGAFLSLVIRMAGQAATHEDMPQLVAWLKELGEKHPEDQQVQEELEMTYFLIREEGLGALLDQ